MFRTFRACPTVGSGNDATLVPTPGTGQLDATVRSDRPYDAAHLIQLLGKDTVTIWARREKIGVFFK